MKNPQLTFFCELDALALETLYADASILNDLTALQAGVSLGILDLSQQRATVVQRLNAAGVPVIAWLLLPNSEGYWFNANNSAQAVARYAAFKTWTVENGLHWDGLGIDIEPDMREIQKIAEDRSKLPSLILGRLFDNERVHKAQAEYIALVGQMRADGYRVESYHIPFIVDERRAGATLLQRITGLIDVPVDREVLMLYTSFMKSIGAGILWSYAPDAGIIGIGNTGGGVEVAGANKIPPLTWVDFKRDLLLAKKIGKDAHIFSLEGCVQQGFLKRLKEFDWDAPVMPPTDDASQINRFRRFLRMILWASAHPALMIGGLLALGWLFRRR
jgi:hypothetical protein